MGSQASTASGASHGWQQTMHNWLVREQRRHDQATWRFIMLGWVGCIGMPAYYLVWTYWFPQEYESLGLRLAGACLCLPAVWASRWRDSRLVEAYLFIAVTFVLPFQFSFLYLMNHGSAVWSQSLLIALIVLFHFNALWAMASYLAGTTLACALFGVVGDPAFLFSPVVLEQLPIYAFTIVVVSLAKVGRRVLANEKLAGMAHGLAAVSHELRTPLVSVDANVRGISRRLAQAANADGTSAADWQAMGDAMARIQYEVRHMNHMIDLFLLSASAVNQHLEATEQLSMQEVVDSVIRRYPFATQAQRDAVTVDIRADFTFAGKHELSVVVLLNLLRNALKALHRAGKGRIRIVVDGRRANPRVLFIDTGCGIAPSQLPLIFTRFYSYPASAGAGIGLALCKEIIDAWQASIRCVSREMAYTIFVLEFPRVRPPAAPHPFDDTLPCHSRSISIPA